MSKIKILSVVIATVLISSLFSCGGLGLAYERLLTDKFYLTATDEMTQMDISYQTRDNHYAILVDQTVFAIGYNDSFIIAKQHSRKLFEEINRDSTFYYIIEVGRAVRERHNFISETYTMRYRELFTDKEGRDSPGPEKIQISKSNYSPPLPERLTYGKYLELRKTLHVPDTLDFTIMFDDLR